MDGYAVQARDLADASPENPITLPVVGEIAAGRSEPIVVTPGTCVRIMTGAPMPRGADSVVPVEWTDGGAATVRIVQQPALGASVRRAGEDLQAGDKVMDRDTVLSSAADRSTGCSWSGSGVGAPAPASSSGLHWRRAP